MPEPVEFVRFNAARKVHVFARHEPFPGTDPGGGALGRYQVASCGRRGLPGGVDGVNVFDDDDLCQRCYRGFTGDPATLFEHRQP